MKTYRCPWCVSRTNHNILYFVLISRTSSLNPANCLWKLRFGLAGRGFERSDLHQIRGVGGHSKAPIQPLNPCLNPSPDRAPAQGAEAVHFDRVSVQVVDIEGWNRVAEASEFEPCRGGKHSLMEDAGDANSSSRYAIKHNVLLMFEPAQARTDGIAGPAHTWILSEDPKAIPKPCTVP